MSALRIKNTSESDPRSYEVTLAVTNKAQNSPSFIKHNITEITNGNVSGCNGKCQETKTT